MLKITIIVLGKLKEKAYAELEKEFLNRLSPFAKHKIIELQEMPYRHGEDLERVKFKESEKIVKILPKEAYIILLQENGKLLGSEAFARLLETQGGSGREIVFVLGSGIGLHQSLKRYSDSVISLSPFTFPHNLARILIEEQIYRACTILAGKKYHK